ncbi:MAG: hypothetical protein HC876_20005 [Chloroflexaceae bacterium]|nr:hypothetical protein [Chloroflexaceae bacterium]NJO07610.1 hypothetical protein [Chloroflexaceae bacterium]
MVVKRHGRRVAKQRCEVGHHILNRAKGIDTNEWGNPLELRQNCCITDCHCTIKPFVDDQIRLERRDPFEVRLISNPDVGYFA